MIKSDVNLCSNGLQNHHYHAGTSTLTALIMWVNEYYLVLFIVKKQLDLIQNIRKIPLMTHMIFQE